jgi:hypothetical protein
MLPCNITKKRTYAHYALFMHIGDSNICEYQEHMAFIVKIEL